MTVLRSSTVLSIVFHHHERYDGRGYPAGVGQLRAAAEYLEAIDMPLYAAAARRRLGELVGGAEGQDLMTRADQWMAGRGVADPARMARVFAPPARPVR